MKRLASIERRDSPKGKRKEIDGIIGRTLREGIPLVALQLRPSDVRDGEIVPELESEIRSRIEALFPFMKKVNTEKLTPNLERLKGQYDRLPDEMKGEISWKTIQSRLLANGADLLMKANELQKCGVLFGIQDGKALIADGGLNPLTRPKIINEWYSDEEGSKFPYKAPQEEGDSLWLKDASEYNKHTIIEQVKADEFVAAHRIITPHYERPAAYRDAYATALARRSDGSLIKSGYRMLNKGEEKMFKDTTGVDAIERETHKVMETRRVMHNRNSKDESYADVRTGNINTFESRSGYRRVLEV